MVNVTLGRARWTGSVGPDWAGSRETCGGGAGGGIVRTGDLGSIFFGWRVALDNVDGPGDGLGNLAEDLAGSPLDALPGGFPASFADALPGGFAGTFADCFL